jgi:prolyl oligopeptidase
MKNKHLRITSLLAVFFLNFNIQAQVMMKTQTAYPDSRQDPSVVDDYHGVKVADPYRWLEDDNSTETKDWVKRQNDLTFGYLDKIPFRDGIKNKLTKLWNYERYGSPFKEGGKYFFYKNDGLQNQAVLYTQESLDAPPSVFLDPNKLSKDGTVALGAVSFNKKGDKTAYSVAKAGSDWQTIHVKDAKTGETLTDEINWVKFSGISWAGDGFYYSRYPEPKKGDELKGALLNHTLYFHKLGTSQADDVLVYADAEHPKRNVNAGVSDDERFIIVTQSEGTSGNNLLIKDTKAANPAFVQIVKDFKSDWNPLDSEGDWIFVNTNYKAARWRIIAINPAMPEEKDWKEIIPEDKTDVLQGCDIIGGKLVTYYLHDASSRVKFYDLTGKFLNELKLPEIGTVGGIVGKRNENEAFYSFSSFIRPNTIFKLNVNTLDQSIFKAPKIDYNPDLFETRQVWYTSKDGTKVPMFISMKKGTKLNGKNPTLLYGYGGFNISLVPSFSVSRIILMEMGGVYASANIRGGGEFGSEWHKAGTKERKQNVFDDFIAAGEYLVSKKYTSKKYLAIQGGSNGGLLVAACMTQRPDLFKVAFPAVGVLDMLRYDKFTIGRAWSVDYGLSEEKEGFEYLHKYSPLQNVKKGTKYPATLITTADHDDRVVPAHSFKFAATLQQAQAGENPALIRIETAAGHGAGKPTAKVIQETADLWAFMWHAMGLVPKL